MPGRMQPTGVSVPGLFVMKEQISKRDRNKMEPDQKTRVERETDKLTGETLRAMCREKVIPKKMRWIIGQKIADLVNDFHTSVNIANSIKVRSHDEFVERHKFQTLAVAYLKATDTKMTLALDVMELNADYFETWAGQYNETLRQIQGWLTKDEKRYSERFGPHQSWIANAEYAGDSPIRAMDRFYTQLFRRHPRYKRKKRYLYGDDTNTRRKARESGARKQKAQERERRSEGQGRVYGDPGLSGDAGGR